MQFLKNFYDNEEKCWLAVGQVQHSVNRDRKTIKSGSKCMFYIAPK